MNKPTKYHNLTNDELLRSIDHMRGVNDMVEELAQRLESLIEPEPFVAPQTALPSFRGECIVPPTHDPL